jgi:hypothetical protein
LFPGSSMVEHSAVNRRVASSNLARGAKFFRIVIIHKSLSTRYRIDALTDRGNIPGGTPAAQGFILLHELSHLMNAIEPDFNNQAKVDKNDKDIEKNCKKLIKALSRR